MIILIATVLAVVAGDRTSRLQGRNQQARKGTASCLDRPGARKPGKVDKSKACCAGVDLQCFGCSPALLALGIPCDEQQTAPSGTQVDPNTARDCYCDSSCILFNDCCDDHPSICEHLYTTTPPGGQSTKTTKKTTTTTTTTTTTKKPKTTTTESNGMNFNRSCPPDRFLESVTNIGNTDYKLTATWKTEERGKKKVFETFTVICKHDSLPTIKTEFTVRSHKRDMRNYCKKEKTIKCGKITSAPTDGNFDGKCKCGATNIVSDMRNGALLPLDIHAQCKKSIKSNKEKWNIFCDGELKDVVKVRNCKVKDRVADIHCGSDAMQCNMPKKDMLKWVNYTKKGGTVENPKKLDGECVTRTRKFDTWRIFCDRNKNGKADNFEEQEEYSFRANAKKARRQRMKLDCS